MHGAGNTRLSILAKTMLRLSLISELINIRVVAALSRQIIVRKYQLACLETPVYKLYKL